MPECVAKWVETHDYLLCQEVQNDILVSYEDDFPKYKKKADVNLLRNILRSTAVQATKKFVYTKVGDYKTAEVKSAHSCRITDSRNSHQCQWISFG